MKRVLGVLLALSFSLPVFPQGLPKASPILATRASQKSSTAPTTTKAPCAADYYRNVNGVCVHRPVKPKRSEVPQGATAQCRDGSYSFSQHHRGTCSHHGGVGRWL